MAQKSNKKEWINDAITLSPKKGESYDGSDGGVLTLYVKKDITLKKGQVLIGKDPLIELQRSLKEGRINQERHDELAAKISHVMSSFTLPPDKEEA